MTDRLRKCPTCKAAVKEGDRFCGYCGSPMEASPPQSAPPGPPTSSGPPAPSGPPASFGPPHPAPPPRRTQAPPRTPSQATDPYEGFREPGPKAPETESVEEQRAPETQAAEGHEEPATQAGEPLPFWIRNRGFGLLFLRLGLGILLIYGWNPTAMGSFAGGEEAELLGDLPYWVEVALVLDLPQLYYGVVGAHMATGFLIILGLLFRPACFVAAGSYLSVLAFQAVWAAEYMTIIDFVQSGCMVLIFLGLMVAGPGRLAVGRAERKALGKKDGG